MTSIAIDLGTTQTKLAVYEQRARGVSLRAAIPSAIYVPRNGALLTGDEALEAIASDPAGAVEDLKHQLTSEGVIRNRRHCRTQELLIALFQDILHIASKRGVSVEQVTTCVLPVPIHWDLLQLDSLQQAAREVGLGNVEFLAEPIACARYQERIAPIQSDTIAVCELGSNVRVAVLHRNKSRWSADFEKHPPRHWHWSEGQLPRSLCDSLSLLREGLIKASIADPPLLLVGGGTVIPDIQQIIQAEAWSGTIFQPESSVYATVLGAVDCDATTPAESGKTCPECKFYPLPISASKCRNCGFRFADPELASNASAVSSNSNDPKTFACPECSSNNAQGVMKCSTCGFPFQT